MKALKGRNKILTVLPFLVLGIKLKGFSGCECECAQHIS